MLRLVLAGWAFAWLATWTVAYLTGHGPAVIAGSTAALTVYACVTAVNWRQP